MRTFAIHTIALIGIGFLAETAANAAPVASASPTIIPHGGWSYPRHSAPESAASTTVAPLAFDPYAPRRDAPIFNLRPSQAPSDPVASPPIAVTQEAPSDRAPSANGSRYYSVHRQAGRRPDTPTLPPPVYLDALPVDLTSPVASDDLAAPPAAPQMIRDANGRLRAVADFEDPL